MSSGRDQRYWLARMVVVSAVALGLITTGFVLQMRNPGTAEATTQPYPRATSPPPP